jgi:hypothetical protein
MKNSLFVIAILFSSFTSNAQTGSDLGIVIGANDLHRLNLEFSKPINETYKFRLGYMQGASYYSFYGYSGKIVSVSDTLIIERFDFKRVAGRADSRFHVGLYNYICVQALCWYSEFALSPWIL